MVRDGRFRVTASGTDSNGQPFSAEKNLQIAVKISTADMASAPPPCLGGVGNLIGTSCGGSPATDASDLREFLPSRRHGSLLGEWSRYSFD